MKISNKTHLKNKRTDVYFSDRERKKKKKKKKRPCSVFVPLSNTLKGMGKGKYYSFPHAFHFPLINILYYYNYYIIIIIIIILYYIIELSFFIYFFLFFFQLFFLFDLVC
jgi:hypothetical protein